MLTIANDHGMVAHRQELIEKFLHTFRIDEPVHMVFMGTKPDIIKQAPVYQELRSRGLQTAVCHSGQHTNHEYSGGMLLEFGIEVDILLDLGEESALSARVASLISLASEIFRTAAQTGHTVIPYVHGDTATAMGAAVAAYMNRVACVHVEAGIRTMTLKSDFLQHHLESARQGGFDWSSYRDGHRVESNYSLGSKEPFPEQFNTRVTDAATGLHAAPVELDRRFLLSEGYPADSITVVGNTVVDAVEAARSRATQSNILDRFPQLASGNFIRVCIHRRETTHNRERFTCYFEAVERLLARGYSVLWVSLNGTEWALDSYDLRDRLRELETRFPETFISTTVWAEYSDVIAAFLRCSLLATDSGSIQEEANILGIPCVTLRFGTDRGESLLAGGNVLAPPLSADFVAQVIERAFQDAGSLVGEQIYGSGSAAPLVDEVLARIQLGSGLFRTEEQCLRLPGTGVPWPSATAQGVGSD